MEIFSGLIDGIFTDGNENTTKSKKRLSVKNTTGFNPEIAAERAARAARAAAKKAAAEKAAANQFDVARVLDKRARSLGKGKVAWRTSIIDLMKVCDMNSSFAARKQLARELGYPEKIISSKAARMNTWLHKEMMRQIVANGGKVSRKLITQ